MLRRRFSLLGLSFATGSLLVSSFVRTRGVTADDSALRTSGTPPRLDSPAQPTVRAKAFLDSLTDAQRSKAMVPFDSEIRTDWHFVPKSSRKGLPLMEMTAEQESAANELLATCVSPDGFSIAMKIMELETLIGRLEGDKAWTDRNPKKYYYTIFGSPTGDERWGFSVEGHHLSLNFVFQGDAIVDSTPQFYAANPACIQTDYEGFEKGLELLKAEERIGFELVQNLSDQQLSKATLAGKTPREIHTAGTPQPTIEPLTGGIAAADLNADQRELLQRLLRAYTDKMLPVVAEERWKLIDESGFDQIVFGWSGGRVAGEEHYYCIQGPTFLVEFINVQNDSAGNPANHIHSVWRDRTGDFDLPFVPTGF